MPTYVIMGNDYPAGVIIGTEAQANIEKDKVAADYARNHPGSGGIYWRVFEEPLLGMVQITNARLIELCRAVIEAVDRGNTLRSFAQLGTSLASVAEQVARETDNDVCQRCTELKIVVHAGMEKTNEQ